MTANQKPPRNWLVTGASSGLGACLVQEIIARGDDVFGVVRTAKDAERLRFLGEHARAITADITNFAQVNQAIDTIETTYGAIDVIVNNAGYGLMGAVEEISLDELRAQLEVNFFAPVNIIQAVLPGMRKRRAGHVINITSVSGLAPWGGTAAYTASKFALEGLGQVLHEELAELGIHVTNVAPGGLRTDFGGRSLRTAAKTIADYAGAGHLPQRVYHDTSGTEPNDPWLAAKAIYAITLEPSPPRHFLLGEDALHYYQQAQAHINRDIMHYEKQSRGISCQQK